MEAPLATPMLVQFFVNLIASLALLTVQTLGCFNALLIMAGLAIQQAVQLVPTDASPVELALTAIAASALVDALIASQCSKEDLERITALL